MRKKLTSILLAVILAVSNIGFIDSPTVALADTASSADTSVGVNTDYHTQEEIISYLEASGASIYDPVIYDEDYSLTQPYSEGKLSKETLESALAMMNQIRYIAGIPSVELDDSYNEQEQKGVFLNAVNQKLAHVQVKPDGMDDDFYSIGANACSHSNLSMGRSNLNYSILDGWVGDYTSDGNLTTLGHRRWLLDPRMLKTGFGAVGKYYGMYAFDGAERRVNSSYTGVAWPARQTPVQYMNAEDPWSYSYGSAITNTSGVSIKLELLGTDKVWNFDSTTTYEKKDAAGSVGYMNIDNNYYATPGCIIFRPKDVTYNPGDVYKVTINGLPTKVEYTVSFFSYVPSIKNEAITLDNDRVLNYKGSAMYFRFTAPIDAKYTFSTLGSLDTMGYLYKDDKYKDSIASNDDSYENGAWNLNFKLEYSMKAGETVYLKVLDYKGSPGTITLRVTSDKPVIQMNTVTLNLSGQIGVNFKVTIPETVMNINGAYAYMTYDGRVTKPMKVLLTDAINEGTLSVFTFPVAVMEYAELVSIKFFDGNDREISLIKASDGSALAYNTYSISAKAYGNLMKGQGDAKLNELLNSLENFGKCAQILFKYKENSVTTPSMGTVTTTMLSAYKPTVVGSNPTGISTMQASLNVESINKIIITCYFANEPVIGDYTFTIDGVKVTPIKASSKTYIVQVDNISSKDLDVTYAIKVQHKAGTAKTVNYSALSYAYGTVGGQLEVETANLSKALYWYNKAANEYFAK